MTTFDAEARRLPEEWIDILDRSSWVVARRGGETVGIACLAAPDEEGPKKRLIESVWVAPNRRRRGLVRQMVQELEDRLGATVPRACSSGFSTPTTRQPTPTSSWGSSGCTIGCRIPRNSGLKVNPSRNI
ncbi:GNAT family N-acetyltransferase [Pseudonocardia charpentierae]|uniref:GNAT family N-acetyltransferase n=1 Tax=Pseudonocardia charpentierae TaxID=3075545 RepID=A0ABU2N911_9PSEU|nr:GNAT family N-acetyltransferase [Pseudonocardia sp. DSM 45834]MDT0349538.1 GNAT family N-acetyltransferase [Pseudonocardia sp. DSM 45834]